jgi:lysophospholipase L1-like esterase
MTTMLRLIKKKQPILAFGDSLTFGYSAEENESYPFILSQLINYPVINAGLNGELSEHGLHRLEGLLDIHYPKLLLLFHGANDILQNLSFDRMAKNINEMIELAQKKNIEVILIAVPDVNQQLNPIPQYKQLADQHQILLVDNLLAELLSQRNLHTDIIHPNALGYRLIAKSLARTIESIDIL